MDRYITIFIIIILGAIGSSLFFSFTWKSHVNEFIKNLEKDHILVRWPKAYGIIGLALVAVSGSLFLLSLNVYKDTRSQFTDIVFLSTVLLGLWLFYASSIWRVEIYRSRDYFTLRSSFLIKQKIYYSDVLEHSRDLHNLVLVTKHKTYRIDKMSTNIEFLMLILNETKNRKRKRGDVSIVRKE